jgi:4-amino-4-deoxy-L-arabinose transferase-like glycosyltransferase
VTVSWQTSTSRPVATSVGLVALLIAALTLVRLIGLKLSTVDLFFDEAQYWAWSQDLSFGYFSKPPLLAWTIALAERVCGSSEACIRAPAPIFYFGTSLLTFAIAKTLYDERTACWTAVLVALAPGAAFSARIISTDVPLLFFWALALLAYVRLLTGPRLGWALVLGLALGLGLMAKYAMIYFVLGIALASVIDGDARALLRARSLWLAFAIAAIVVAPNALWNLANGLVTFRHVGENIEGDGVAVDPLRALGFVAAQFAVFGPVVFAVLSLAVFRIRSLARADRLMLAFAIPPLALVTTTAVVTHANANWAAAAFVSAAVLAAAILVRRAATRWLNASLALGVAVQILMLGGDTVASRIGLAKPLGDPYRRTLGWRALGEAAGQLARQTGAVTIAGEARPEMAAMLYYGRDEPERVVAWPSSGPPEFDLTHALTDASAEPILLVSICPFPERLRSFYTTVEPLGLISTPTGPNSVRDFAAFKLAGRRAPIGPLPQCSSGVHASSELPRPVQGSTALAGQ